MSVKELLSTHSIWQMQFFPGATLYVSEQKYELDTKVPYILVSDIRKAMPYLGKLFFNDPSKELNLIGVGRNKREIYDCLLYKSDCG